jgi:hypothetical protein
MKSIILPFLLLPFIGFSQEFHKFYGQSQGELGKDIIEMSDGNFLVAGLARDTVSNTLDAILMKVDTNGILIWSKTYGGSQGDDAFYSIIEDSGFIYACGYTESYSTDSVADVFLVKTDLYGNISWSETYGGSGCAGPYCGDVGHKIIKEADNSYIISGRFASVGSDLMAGYVLRIDSTGSLVNEYIVDGVGSEWLTNVSLAQNGDLLLTGVNKVSTWEPWVYRMNPNGTSVFNKGYGTVVNHNGGFDLVEYNNELYFLSDKSANICLTKLDSVGDTLMVKEYGITGTSHPSDLLLSSDTNFYILGAIGNSTVLMKTDLNGDTLWVNYYQGLGTGLKLIEKNNHLYIVGGTSSFGNGLSDIILMKVASDGSSSNCNETTSSTFFTNPSSVIITTWAEGNSAFTTSTSVTATTNILSLEECQACIIADFDFSVINNVVTFNNLSNPGVSYYWDFGDLNTSSDLNPSNTYSICGTFDVCLVAYDSCSSDTIYQTIDIKPTVLTNNLTVYLDASGAASISIADIDSSSSDNCSSSLSLDITSFDCNDVGANTVTLTATDVNSNVDSATAVVTVVDTIRPTVLTNNPTVYLDASGAASITTTYINNSSFDNCGISSLSLDISSFDCNDVGANTVTLTVTDVNGNVDSATAVVTVVDTIRPTVLTNNLPIYLNASGAASITTTDINNSSFDNCGISSLSLDITSFDCNDVGANTVVLTATDVNSNSSSATAIVIVLDTISPVILTVPNDITLGYCDALYTYSAPTASDNCSFTIAQIAGISSGSKFPIGTTTNTFVVTDASGNQNITSFDVTIIQEYLPFVLSDLSYCGNYTQVNLSQGRDSITFAGIGVGSNAISFEPVIAGVGTHTITATFIDTMGCVTNGTFDIQVLEAPTVPNITRVASDKIRVDQEYESYQWYRNGTIIEGERAQLYRAMELGLYTVLAGNGNKCYEISEGYEFGIPFQEDEVIQQNRVTVYPNPTEGHVFIEFKNGEDTHIVTLTNGLGVELIKVNTDQRVYRLDISNLAAGPYTVNVVSSTINESVQIIKK